jgi:A/G-specific adenine glycosylase
MALAGFASRILRWYAKSARSLPWRGSSEPYRIWISEVMLQQTRVEAVIPYFERWMRELPTLQDLAHASERHVLRLWEGLGYYSRARNLQKSASMVQREFGGRLPSRTSELRKLPGIGRYTAGAISSMAFGLHEPALDGNIRRVLARVFNVTQPADSAAGRRLLWSLAAAQLPKSKAGDYNQALMDLGALICLPKEPRCLQCPVRKMCRAYGRGIQDQLPVLKPRKPTPHYQRLLTSSEREAASCWQSDPHRACWAACGNSRTPE